MQKWSPDPFESPGAIVGGLAVDDRSFEAQAAPTPEGSEPGTATRFRSESGFTDAQTLLAHLTRKERAQLFDLVEQDVSSEYEEREKNLKDELDRKTQEIRDEHLAQLGSMAEQIDRNLSATLNQIAAESARLALQMAAKIVRRTVDFDPEVLVRALETTHYKLLESTDLQITLNPEDLDKIKDQPELMKQLHISDLHADRRIEKGGCVVRTESQEWDATIERQIESMEELVEEAIVTAGTQDGTLLPEDTHEPEVE